MNPGEQPAISAPPPDWDAIESDFFCPLCDYNLRGLAEPRCPECGFRFDWPDILDPQRRLHPYIFEHHPERNFRSFWQTAFAGWRPRRFWTSLHPAQPSRPRRLILYWCLAMMALFIAGILAPFLASVGHYRSAITHAERTLARIKASQEPRVVQARNQLIQKYGSLEAYMALAEPIPAYSSYLREIVESEEYLIGFAALPLSLLAWVLLTFSSLLIFRWSMKKARVKTIHVLRCLLYSSDSGLWIGLLASLLTLACLQPAPVSFPLPRWLVLAQPFCLPVTFWLLPYRLWAAYRYYLRFDRPLLTVAASQIIVALIFFNLVIALRVWF